MSLRCKLGKHKAIPSDVWNRGYFFSRCARCNEQMISRAGQPWQVVPRGYRVVWKERTARDLKWVDLRKNTKPRTLTEILGSGRHESSSRQQFPDEPLPWRLAEDGAERATEVRRILKPQPRRTKGRHLSA